MNLTSFFKTWVIAIFGVIAWNPSIAQEPSTTAGRLIEIRHQEEAMRSDTACERTHH